MNVIVLDNWRSCGRGHTIEPCSGNSCGCRPGLPFPLFLSQWGASPQWQSKERGFREPSELTRAELSNLWVMALSVIQACDSSGTFRDTFDGNRRKRHFPHMFTVSTICQCSKKPSLATSMMIYMHGYTVDYLKIRHWIFWQGDMWLKPPHAYNVGLSRGIELFISSVCFMFK